MTTHTVTVVINQQQEEMLDRLVAEQRHGSTHAEVIRSGFVAFCREHPEFLAGERGEG